MSRGVAILLNKQWCHLLKESQPVNERIAYADIKREKFELRIVAAYCPHVGYSYDHVQKLYDT